MLQINLFIVLFVVQFFVLLDGVMVIELEVCGCDLVDSLWLVKVLLENLQLICDVYFDYFCVGVQVVIIVSYQVILVGFVVCGLDEVQFWVLIGKSVELVCKVCEVYFVENLQVGMLLVVGLVGLYGVFFVDGLEYCGDYQCSVVEFQVFYCLCVEVLLDVGVDLLVCEILLLFVEIQVLVVLLQEYFCVCVWYFFMLCDVEYFSDGMLLCEVMVVLVDNLQVVVVGINCIVLENMFVVLVYLYSLMVLLLVVYFNFGEYYDVVSKIWYYYGEVCVSLVDYLLQWLVVGVKLIGGCCCIMLKDIVVFNVKC